MKNFEIITCNSHIKDIFGSFKILDDIDVADHPSIYEFAKLVFNYIKMEEINEKPNTTQIHNRD